jgi:glycine betaine/choline ABC-type transport system substrate-binding protein
MTNYESDDFYTTVLSGGTGSVDTITVTSSIDTEPYILTDTCDNITINTDFLSHQTLTVGDVTINQSTLKDLVTLIDVLKELDDDNPLKAMFDSKKMLDKMKIGK